jgi:DeoR/GlpR family transcriptional regulator of sugar metabolism
MRGASLPSVRQLQILQFVRANPYVTVREISERWKISFVTARRDLDGLAEQGVVRLRGGARTDVTADQEESMDSEVQVALSQGGAVAARAAALVTTGMSVGICAGAHDLSIARAVCEITGVSIVTNSIRAADFIWRRQHNIADGTFALLTPGTPNATGALGGPLCIRALEQFSFDLSYASVRGFQSGRASFTDNQSAVEVFGAFRCSSKRVVLLLDETRAEGGPVLLDAPKRGDLLVGDAALAPERRRELEAAGYELLLAA